VCNWDISSLMLCVNPMLSYSVGMLTCQDLDLTDTHQQLLHSVTASDNPMHSPTQINKPPVAKLTNNCHYHIPCDKHEA
jgi:hypothetical protein